MYRCKLSIKTGNAISWELLIKRVYLAWIDIAKKLQRFWIR